MANIEHVNIPNASLHEPKGVSAAAVNKVYVSNGSGSGTWQKITESQLDGLTATFAELNAIGDISTSAVAAGSALTIVEATHAGRTIKLDTATGSVVTLPVATGSGAKYVFVESIIATSNNHKIKVTDANGLIKGVVFEVAAAGTGTTWPAPGSTDTITFPNTSGEGRAGTMIIITDVSSNVYSVFGHLYNEGGGVTTPFSSVV